MFHKTSDERMERLKRFYRQVRPSFGWRPVALAVEKEDGRQVPTDPALPATVAWVSCTIMVYAAIMGLGKILLCSATTGFLSLIVFAVSLYVTVKAVRNATQ